VKRWRSAHEVPDGPPGAAATRAEDLVEDFSGAMFPALCDAQGMARVDQRGGEEAPGGASGGGALHPGAGVGAVKGAVSGR
jgi:hypothetical protein